MSQYCATYVLVSYIQILRNFHQRQAQALLGSFMRICAVRIPIKEHPKKAPVGFFLIEAGSP